MGHMALCTQVTTNIQNMDTCHFFQQTPGQLKQFLILQTAISSILIIQLEQTEQANMGT